MRAQVKKLQSELKSFTGKMISMQSPVQQSNNS